MVRKTVSFAILMTVVFLYTPLFSADYAIISKSVDDANFADTATGCNQAAALNGDRCVHLGPRGPADSRNQVAALRKAARSGKYAGVAISVVLSEEVAKVVRRDVRVPVISFDSPFLSNDADAAAAYVGTENIAFGRDLAGIAKTLRPAGGTVFLMGDLHDSNLRQRINGVRRAFYGDTGDAPDSRLNGQNGWREFDRSPWRSGDDIERSLDQVTLMLKSIKPDVFISVGHWPVVDPGRYRKAVAPFAGNLRSGKHLMIFGVGKITPDLQNLLDDRLIHGLISIDFFEIGRQVYKTLDALSNGRSVPAETIVPNIIRIAG